jgi:hypothetical protein
MMSEQRDVNIVNLVNKKYFRDKLRLKLLEIEERELKESERGRERER